MSVRTTNGIIGPHTESNDICVTRDDTIRQAALLLALMIDKGCSAEISKEEFSANAIESVKKGKERLFDRCGANYAAYNMGVRDENFKGFYEMSFSGSAFSFLLRECCGISTENMCSYNYPFYSRVNKIVVRDEELNEYKEYTVREELTDRLLEYFKSLVENNSENIIRVQPYDKTIHNILN